MRQGPREEVTRFLCIHKTQGRQEREKEYIGLELKLKSREMMAKNSIFVRKTGIAVRR
jgi:hypothetical protein